MRLLVLVGIAVLVAPMGASAQATEHDHVPRGFNLHPVTVQPPPACAAGRDLSPDHYRLVNRIDPIPTYGWVWVTVDAIKNLEWPRAAGHVNRFSWNGVLTRSQRDSVRAYEGTPVVVDGYFSIDERTASVVSATAHAAKSSRNCDQLENIQLNWHLWLTGRRDEQRADAIAVTVSPQLRQQGWETWKLREIARRGLMVRVWGWLLFDQDPAQPFVARRYSRGTSPWAVYPIVEIEVFQNKHTLVPLREWGERVVRR
jgi:hypothetical protein